MYNKVSMKFVGRTGIPCFFLFLVFLLRLEYGTAVGPYYQSMIAGTGTASSGADNIAATSSALSHPYQMFYSSVNNFNSLLVTDSSNDRVRKINSDGIVTNFAGSTSTSQIANGMPATSTYMNGPAGVCVNNYGTTFIATMTGSRIFTVSTNSYIASVYAGVGTASPTATGVNGDNGQASSATLNTPYYLFTDNYAVAYVGDSGNNRVRSISATGIITTVAGNGVATISGTSGPATRATMVHPFGVFLDTTNRLFITENEGYYVKMVVSSTISVYAGVGVAGYSGNGGPATSAQMYKPNGIFGDSSGNIFIAEYTNQVVRVIDSQQIINVVLGTSNSITSLYLSGMGTSTPIGGPVGVHVDSSGYLYVSDLSTGTGGSNVRRSYSLAPTTSPSRVPSICPSVQPTAFPSIKPSVIPSTSPSFSPSLLPTIIPTIAPTCVPTLIPTTLPSVPPTLQPSNNPSLTPTTIPSCMPTVTPSFFPTVSPSMLPSVTPSCVPTLLPSLNPTFTLTSSPSILPTLVPTPSPTIKPSASPSVIPSLTPSSSPQAPTASPSGVRSSQISITTIAGTGSQASTGTGSVASLAAVNTPSFVFEDSTGMTFVSEWGGNCVRKFSYPNGIVAVFAGICGNSANFAGDNGQASSASSYSPSGIVADSLGVFYVVETGNNRIRVISNGIISTVTGSNTAADSADGGLASTATVNVPYGIWVDTNGHIYIASYSGHKIRKITRDSRVITLVAGTGTGGYDSDNIPATNAKILNPRGISVDSVGNVYIVDYGNQRLRLVNSLKIISTMIGTGSTGFIDSLPATSFNLNSPYGVAVDASNGDVYVASNGYRRIVVRTGSTGVVSNVAGTGSPGPSGDGFAATAAGIVPVGLCLDSSGNLLHADDVNHRVRVMYSVAPSAFPTFTQTISPSVSPSIVPTQLPSRLPSTFPSVIPSINPTLSPSTVPSVNPSFSPSCVPSLGPTVTPSVVPTVAPSVLPTVMPTCVPTLSPTILPSIVPTTPPSVVPTSAPSITPTLSPTHTPSIDPSVSPSIIPSLSPTISPSILPTATPSITPTQLPSTISPSVTPSYTHTITPSFSPSLIPSIGPSIGPTFNPTVAPSVIPTATPSVVPTASPSISPSLNPTALPSVISTITPSSNPVNPSLLPTAAPFLSAYPTAPTVNPSALPSIKPTVSPTVLPTVEPSAMPTVTPSVLPSVSPSVGPSVLPSVIPSTTPSVGPSVTPSLLPTQGPTVLPTTSPSVGPSPLPSLLPSVLPSLSPSFDPSQVPTLSPSIQPSAVPSVQPSRLPTVGPTVLPTCTPVTVSSELPTVSPSQAPISPSKLPSVVPTLLPTASPSVEPSNSPSLFPTTTPSAEPSLMPSLNPSVGPTVTPSIGPSVIPTALPSIDPSESPTLVPTVTPYIAPSLLPSAVPIVQPSLIPTISPSRSPSVGPSIKPTLVPTVRPSVLPSVVPTIALPTVSAAPSSPTIKPTRCPTFIPSVKPTRSPTLRVTLIPTTPTFRPSTSLQPIVSRGPSMVPTEIPSAAPSAEPVIPPSRVPSIVPSALPTQAPSSAVPTTSSPTAVPSTVEFYAAHPKATLPFNQSISVIGNYGTFKIVLPFLVVSSGPYGRAFSDIFLTADISFVSHLVPGGPNLPATINSLDGASYGGAGGFDVSKRAVSVLDDVNGDGAVDLIIGDPYLSKCYVMFGNEQGLANMTKGFTIFGESEGDLTGWSVSGAGDVNNDTLADIIVGAPNANGVGAVYVIYGRRFNSFDVYLNNLTASQGYAMYGAQKSDYLGISVSNAGDVNGDGCDDVIMGGVMTSLYFAGAAYIVYGGRSLRTMTTQQLIVVQGYKLTGVSYGYFGYSVSAAGDVNKDGLDDVLIGSSPQRSTLVPTACLVYGSKSVTGDVSLAGLTSSQGVRITGGGMFVSSAGDVDGNGYDDMLIGGSSCSSASVTGCIVFSNTTFMIGLSSQPSAFPSNLPVFAPTKIPTRIPSRAPLFPTVAPSKVPSVSPSTTPTAPTDAPTPGVSQPSSQPSSLPSVPTVAPSAEPSEVPTVPPSREPSESPTHHPTEAPSELPTVLPTVGPSEMPTVIPSMGPSSLEPTTPTLTRAPFSVPSLAPTVKSSVVTLTAYYIEGAAVIDNQLDGNQNYIVNTSESVSINNVMGNNIYTILPHVGSELTVVYFNNSNDVIDLTAFKIITEFKQLLISEGSIILTLPSEQIVHILNLHPSDVSESNFVFYQEITTKPPETKTTKTLSVVAGVLIAIGGLILGSLMLMRLCNVTHWFRKVSAVTDKNRFLMEVKYTKDGKLIQEVEESVEGDIESYQQENMSATNSTNLSEHTINSDGVWVERNQSASTDEPVPGDGRDFVNWDHQTATQYQLHAPVGEFNAQQPYWNHQHPIDARGDRMSQGVAETGDEHHFEEDGVETENYPRWYPPQWESEHLDENQHWLDNQEGDFHWDHGKIAFYAE